MAICLSFLSAGDITATQRTTTAFKDKAALFLCGLCFTMTSLQCSSKSDRMLVKCPWKCCFYSGMCRGRDVEEMICFGHFHALYHEFQEYSQKFFNYTHMKVSKFDALFEIARPRMMRIPTDMRCPVSLEEHLFLTLRQAISKYSLYCQFWRQLPHQVPLPCDWQWDFIDDICLIIRYWICPLPTYQYINSSLHDTCWWGRWHWYFADTKCFATANNA